MRRKEQRFFLVFVLVVLLVAEFYAQIFEFLAVLAALLFGIFRVKKGNLNSKSILNPL